MAYCRPSLTRLLVVIAVAAFLPATALAARSGSNNSLDAGVLVQLNQIRVAHGLAPLTLSAPLSKAAGRHSSDMVAKGYFAHESSNGAPFWQRIKAFYPSASYSNWSVGENLFWSTGPVDPAEALAAWMASPEHRANILDPAWRQVGIGAASSSRAPGAFAGLGVTVITTDFGERG